MRLGENFRGSLRRRSFPRMVRVGLQHRSSMSDMVAAGIFNPAPQRAQVSSTEL